MTLVAGDEKRAQKNVNVINNVVSASPTQTQ